MVKVFGDKIIWTVSILLFLISVLLVYSSGGYESLASHITHLGMGLGLVFIFSRFNYKYFTNLSSILLIISVCMLLWLIINPGSYRGDVLASRWIKLGFISFQPSELAKYSLILFVCRNLFIHKESLSSFISFALYIILPTIIICGLIIPSNLSTVILIVILLFFIVFISGYPLVLFFKHLILPLLIVCGLFFTILCIPPQSFIDELLPRLTTWKNRIVNLAVSTEAIVVEKDIIFWDNQAKKFLFDRVIEKYNIDEQKIKKWNKKIIKKSEADNIVPSYLTIILKPYNVLALVDRTNYDPDNSFDNNYQTNYALGAIHSGGFLGKGAGKNYYSKLLPESKSDFIFAILIEEYGLLGGGIVLALYLLFYQRILVLSIKSKEAFPRLLLLGLGSVIVFQALLHMAVSVNLIPVTGQTLPLISKGGSSVWVTCLAFGIILNISHQINNQVQS